MNKVFHCPEDNALIADILSRVESTEISDHRATRATIKAACDHAIKYRYGRVVPFRQYLPLAAGYLKGSSVKLVEGSNDMSLQSERLYMFQTAFELGVSEIDMIGRMSLFFDKKYDAFQKEISETAALAARYGGLLKIIIETGYLTDDEKLLAAKLSLEAGATFIKFCLGIGLRKGRGTVHDVLLLRDAFGDKIKIKASGGIASLEDAYAMLRAGADRVAIRGALAAQLEAIGYQPPEEGVSAPFT